MSDTVCGVPRAATKQERQLNWKLFRAAAEGARRYLALSGVVGVGPGLRARGGVETGELCVQFLVRKKHRRPGHPLPHFVYARDRSGRLDYRTKFATDVVEVGRPEFACGGGAPIEADSEEGTITLIFRNRAPRGNRAWYLLTCSHVASDLNASPPDDPAIEAAACVRAPTFANTIKNTLPKRQHLGYDIALAELTSEARNELGSAGLTALDGRVSEDGTRLTAFIDRADLRPSLAVQCQLGVSGARNGRVTWGPGPVRARLGGDWLELNDVYMTNIRAVPGDSGGIVFSDDLAVGLIFARSEAHMAWLQPLEPAVQHLAVLEPEFSLQVF